jgi:hypothetical protein
MENIGPLMAMMRGQVTPPSPRSSIARAYLMIVDLVANIPDGPWPVLANRHRIPASGPA